MCNKCHDYRAQWYRLSPTHSLYWVAILGWNHRFDHGMPRITRSVSASLQYCPCWRRLASISPVPPLVPMLPQTVQSPRLPIMPVHKLIPSKHWLSALVKIGANSSSSWLTPARFSWCYRHHLGSSSPVSSPSSDRPSSPQACWWRAKQDVLWTKNRGGRHAISRWSLMAMAVSISQTRYFTSAARLQQSSNYWFDRPSLWFSGNSSFSRNVVCRQKTDIFSPEWYPGSHITYRLPNLHIGMSLLTWIRAFLHQYRRHDQCEYALSPVSKSQRCSFGYRDSWGKYRNSFEEIFSKAKAGAYQILAHEYFPFDNGDLCPNQQTVWVEKTPVSLQSHIPTGTGSKLSNGLIRLINQTLQIQKPGFGAIFCRLLYSLIA